MAEPGIPHRHGSGKSPGLVMAAFGDLPLARITTRDVSAFLRALDEGDIAPRTVNKHRQLLSAIFNYARQGDTRGPGGEPGRGNDERREPPPAVLDFYEPEEIDALAQAAAAGTHPGSSPRTWSPMRSRGEPSSTARVTERASPSRELRCGPLQTCDQRPHSSASSCASASAMRTPWDHLLSDVFAAHLASDELALSWSLLFEWRCGPFPVHSATPTLPANSLLTSRPSGV